MSKALSVVKYNFQISLKSVYIITGIVMLIAILTDVIVSAATGSQGSNDYSLYGNYFVLIVLLAPILIVAKHYKRLINIGAKKLDFFKGCLINYAIIAVVVSLLTTLYHFVILPLLPAQELQISFISAFGWGHSFLACLANQIGIFMLVSLFLHTLVLFHQTWIGIALDILIVSVIATFIPIAPLRSSLVWFFGTFLLNPNTVLMLINNLILGGVIYTTTLYVMAKK